MGTRTSSRRPWQFSFLPSYQVLYNNLVTYLVNRSRSLTPLFFLRSSNNACRHCRNSNSPLFFLRFEITRADTIETSIFLPPLYGLGITRADTIKTLILLSPPSSLRSWNNACKHYRNSYSPPFFVRFSNNAESNNFDIFIIFSNFYDELITTTARDKYKEYVKASPKRCDDPWRW